jgi:hypothetical protein
MPAAETSAAKRHGNADNARRWEGNMFIATRLWTVLSDASARGAILEDNDVVRKFDGPDLNGAGQDVAIDELDVDSNGVHLDSDGDPTRP